MTLVVFVRCNDGFVIISDRKETNTSNVGQITKKYYLSKNQEFILALAGDSPRIDIIFTSLIIDNSINSNSIISKLDKIIEKAPIFGGGLIESSGLLITKEKKSFVFHNVWFTNSQRSIVEENPKFKCYGDGAALADYLIRKFDLQNIPWNIACQYLIAVMQEVSTSIDSVGSLEKFGFDIIVLTDTGEIKSCTLNEWDGKRDIFFSFKPDSDKNIECLLPTLVEPEVAVAEPEVAVAEPQHIITQKTEPKPSTAKPPQIIEDSIKVSANKKIHDLKYSISNGKLISGKRDFVVSSLILFIESSDDGQLTISLPRDLLDAKLGKQDDIFFVLADGEEMEFEEIKADSYRKLTIPFYKGTEEIEIIGTEFILSTDKQVYTYGDKIIVTMINAGENEGNPLQLIIKNKNGENILQKEITVEKLSKGSHQEVIPIEGKSWVIPKQDYKIILKYEEKSKEVTISTDDFGTKIELEQKVYSWTDKVNIIITAPELIRDHSKIQSIGNTTDQQITISTSSDSLDFYRLEETRQGTGIFEGSVILTGFKGHEAIKKDKNKENRGFTDGKGPHEGHLACSNSDGLTVKLKTLKKIITGSAIIRWNIGEIQWLNASYPEIGKGEIRLVDPDINLDPNSIDEVEIRVWSDSDAAGIPLILKETEKNTGIFKGEVYFTRDESNSPKLMVSEGDTITAEYLDKTLPEPYSVKNELAISSTSMIGALSPPLEKISILYASIVDSYDNQLAQISTGQTVLVRAKIKNNQNKPQDFSYIIQVQDDQSTSISLSSISGTLDSNQSLSPALSWIPPRAGEYEITIFIWEAMDNPTALSPPTTLTIKAVGEEKPTPTPKSIQIKKADAITETIARSFETLIKIPSGSSEPGCQETDECYIPSRVKIKVNKTAMWKNDDNAAHTVTSGTPDSGPDGEFDSGLFDSGKSFAHTFKKKGAYPYFCMLHPWQTGIITVE